MRNATLRPPGRASQADEYPAMDSRKLEPAARRGRWLLWLAGLVVVGLFGAVVWYAYVEGLAGLGGEPPLIRAEPGPYKHVPDERGGLAVANLGSSVIDVFRPEPQEPADEPVPPPPPEPSVDLTQPEERIAAPPDVPDLATLPPSRVEPPAPAPPEPPAAAEPPPPPPPAAEAPPATPAPAPPSAASDDTEVAGPPAGGWIPAPKPELPQVAAVPEPPPAPDLLETPEDEPPALPRLTPPPERRPAVTEPRPAPVASRPARQPEPRVTPRRPPPPTSRVTAAIEPPRPTPPPAPAVPVSPSRVSNYRLQLLALRSEGAMNQAWSQLRQRYPNVLSELSPSVERIATVSGTMYRLQAGPFASREAATSACSAIQAQGGQCFVVSSAQ